MANQWKTPDAPAPGFICRTLNIPNSIAFLSIVDGALDDLTDSFNFQQDGALTPAQTAAYFQTMYDLMVAQKSAECRMVAEIIPYAGATSPNANWLLCDGASYLITAWPALFAVIGTTYGSVDGTHFNVPDLRGRVGVGVGSGPGLSPRSLGAVGGEENHALTSAENGAHSHSYVGPGVPFAALIGVLPADGSPGLPATTGVSGSGTGHNTMQPFAVINYLIVAS